MSIWSDRLNWITETHSLANVSRETGVPYRQLLSIKAGGITPPGFGDTMTNYWGRYTYNRMIETGVPRWQAARYRGGGLGSVQTLTLLVSRLVDQWAFGAALVRYRLITNEPGDEFYRYMEDTRHKIRDRLRDSEKGLDPEDIDAPYK